MRLLFAICMLAGLFSSIHADAACDPVVLLKLQAQIQEARVSYGQGQLTLKEITRLQDSIKSCSSKDLNASSKEIEEWRLSAVGSQQTPPPPRDSPAQCTPVDLRGPQLGEVRDQDSVGWCYAFTAADLLSYKTGKRISALGVAVTYNVRPRPPSNNPAKDKEIQKPELQSESSGGTVSTAIQAAQQAGACLEEDLNSEDNGQSDLQVHLHRIEATLENSSRTLTENCQESFYSAQTLFPNLNLEDFRNIVETSSRHELVSNLAQHSCQAQELPEFETTQHSTMTPESRLAVFEQIDEQLNQSNPVAISYDSRQLRNKNFQGTINAPHVSSLVGRRYNTSTGECEYLLRNSWGRSCGGYDPSYTCEEGNLWMPKSAITRSLYSVTYLN